MEHRTQKLIIMDLKKLLNESESLKQAITDQNQADDLKRYLGIPQPEELEKIMNAARSGIPYSAAFTSEKAARQAAENALGLGSFPATDFQTAAEKMKKEFERTAGLGTLASSDPLMLSERFRADIEKASGMLGRENASDLQGRTYINFEEIEEREKERQQERMMQLGNEHTQYLAREAAEFRRREDAKVEYARRSAEASEEALAEERRKLQEAELAANEANADRDKADKRAERAELREARMERWTIYAILVALIAAAITAWPFLKDHLGL